MTDETLIKWLDGNQLGIDIVTRKYLQPNETCEEWFDRVSGGDADFKRLIKEKKFLPGGRILANRGLDKKGVKSSLSNCYVLAVDDSIESIYKTCADMARTYSYGGGVGIDISKLRPRGAKVNNTAKETTGAVSFMPTFDTVTGTIGQCIDGEALVITEDGVKTLKDVKIGDKVYTKNGFVKVINKINQGTRATKKVTTKFGYEINATEDHPFITCNENNPLKTQELKEFNIGDDIVVMGGKNLKQKYVKLDTDIELPKHKNVNQYGECGERVHNLYKDCTLPEFIDERLGYILGYMSGDGYTDKTNVSVTCNSTDDLIISKIKKYTKEIFDVECTIKDRHTYQILTIGRKEIKLFFEKNEINKPKTEYLRVPKLIFESPSSVQVAYLSGLMDSDGYVSTSRNLYRITTVNHEFAVDIQRLLSINGVTSKIQYDTPKNPKWKTKNNVTIIGCVNKQRLQNNLTESIKVTTKEVGLGRDGIISPYTSKSVGSSRTMIHNYIPAKGFISINCLERLINEGVYQGEILIKDNILNIEDSGEREVYDITLESENMFWCNGFYVHNCGRRGALMISISVNHPDVYEFVDIKANTDSINNANISIRVNDDFMRAVDENKDYLLHWPCDMTINEKELEAIPEYGVLTKVDTASGPVYLKKIKARDLFNKLVKNNWDYAEPGILYWDRIENYHLMSKDPDFKYAGVNPCAEEPLNNGSSCLLGSCNLYLYVKDNGEFDYQEFDKDCRIATKALNDIQMEGTPLHPLQIQKESAKKYRQIGFGLFDLGGALIKMGIRYGSEEAQAVAEKITHTMLIAAFEKSCDLNDELGIHAIYDHMFESEFYKTRVEPFIAEKYKGKYPLNSQLLTIAPTGTISTMINATSGGGEPMFALSYTRNTKSIGEKAYKVYPQAVLDYYHGNVDAIDENNMPDFFITAGQLDPMERVKMQAALQKNIDASISSTVNLNEKTTVEDVYNIYMEAWKNGLKGITIFRDNCKRAAILTTSSQPQSDVKFNTIDAPKRPKTLEADFYQVKVNGENFRIFVGLYDGKPYELFAMPCAECERIPNHKGKITRIKKRVYQYESDYITIDNIAIDLDKDYDIFGEIDKISDIVNEGKSLKKSDVEIVKDSVYNIKNWSEKREYRNVALHISGNLRTGMRLEDIIKLEEKCNDNIVSFNKAVSRVLSKYLKEVETSDKCPECGSELRQEGGCVMCPNCGWSRCS